MIFMGAIEKNGDFKSLNLVAKSKSKTKMETFDFF